jgi:hypothetical protein
MAARPSPLWLLAACLAALLAAGCASAPPAKEPEKPTDPCARTAPAGVVLRGGEVLKSRGGPVAADVWNPLAVELLPDGRIRARDPKGDPIEGFAPEPKGTAAGEERGLGVYVQTETPIYLAPKGPEIGRAFPGAYLPVLSVDACNVQVILRAFSPASGDGPMKAWLPVDAVGTKELILRPAPTPLRHVRDQRRVLRAEPGDASSAFARTRCGRMEVLEVRQDKGGADVQRVGQSEQGVELRGWVDRPIVDARGDDDCPVRLLDKKQVVGFDGEASLPEGYAALGDGLALGKELEKLAKKDRTIYVPLVDGLGARCEAFKLRAKGAELVRADPDKTKKAESWQVRLAEGRLTVSGPCRGGGLCSLPYLIVGMASDRIVLLPARDDLASRAGELLAYHQDDTEPWYLERSACEAQGGVDHASSLLPLP